MIPRTLVGRIGLLTIIIVAIVTVVQVRFSQRFSVGSEMKVVCKDRSYAQVMKDRPLRRFLNSHLETYGLPSEAQHIECVIGSFSPDAKFHLRFTYSDSAEHTIRQQIATACKTKLVEITEPIQHVVPVTIGNRARWETVTIPSGYIVRESRLDFLVDTESNVVRLAF